jgi:hypothetical protein
MRRRQATAARKATAALLAVAVVTVLAAGLAGGLMRAGVLLPVKLHGAWLLPAVAQHAFLMIVAFFGTVIGLERAVALGRRAAFAVPGLSALGGLALLAGHPAAGAWLGAAAGVGFVAVNVAVVRRQRAPHTMLLLAAACAWAIGSALHALAASAAAVVPWWFAFLVVTIAAERLEMTRLMRRRRSAAPALHAVLALLFAGCALSGLAPRTGGFAYGVALVALSLWLLAFDIARRTVFVEGLPRYMALCLLPGYAWLGVAGVAWCATSLGLPARDAALHALAIGFVFSMMLGHAPVVVPALTRLRPRFGWPYYVPLALLHGSLLVRLLRPADGALAAGAAGNAFALFFFAVVLLASAAFGRKTRRNPARNDAAAAH